MEAGEDEDAGHIGRYEEYRYLVAQLQALEYPTTGLDLEVVPLVKRLVADLIRTTESCRRIIEENKILQSTKSQLEEQLSKLMDREPADVPDIRSHKLLLEKLDHERDQLQTELDNKVGTPGANSLYFLLQIEEIEKLKAECRQKDQKIAEMRKELRIKEEQNAAHLAQLSDKGKEIFGLRTQVQALTDGMAG